VRRLIEADGIADLLGPYEMVDRAQPPGRPWVLANMVGGLDGSAARGGRVGDLTDATDQRLFRSLRAVADVVLVGAGTVRAERYGAVRLDDDLRSRRVAAGRPPVPALAVVSRSLALDWDAPLFAAAEPGARTVVVTTKTADADLRARAAEVADVVEAGEDRVDLAAAVAALGAGVVLCEGGPTLLGELAALGLLDELCLTLSPVMGGDPLPVAVSPPGAPLTRLALAHTLVEDGTLFLRYERVAA
jgi:riboflavin biosynthesis pyrimidine reductase